MSKLIKICGKRSAFLSFIAVINALLIVYGISIGKYYLCIVSFAFFLLLVTYSIINKFKALFVLLLSIFSVFLLYGFCTFDYVDNIKINTETTYTIIGKIPTSINCNDVYYNCILENCSIYDEFEQLVYDNKYIRFTCKEDLYTPISGDIILFKAKINKEDLFKFDKFNNYNIPYGIYFSSFANNDLNVISENILNIKDKIQLKIKDAFYSSMSNKSANLAYATTFGDKTQINNSVINGFRQSGLAHILAISGLHTSIIFVMLAFVLSRIKRLNKNIIGIIIAIALLLYAYLCNFSPSIIRASIMCLVTYFSFSCARKPDTLNNLGVAGLIILALNPFDLFNIGFCLSFACILGIALFANNISKLFKNKKFEFITSIFAVTLATQIATLPFMAYYFGYFSFTTFIANILLLPLFIFLFHFIIIFAIISIIFTPTLLLNGLSFGLDIFINLSVALSNLDFLIVPLFKIGIIGILCYFVLTYTLANKFFIKRKTKLILSSILVVVIALSCIYSTVPKTETNISFIVKDCPNTHYFKVDNKLNVINPFNNSTTIYNTEMTLNLLCESKIDNIILNDYIRIAPDKLEDFLKDYNVRNVYIANYLYDEYSLISKILNAKTNLIILDSFTLYDIGAKFKLVPTLSNLGYIEYYINDNTYIVEWNLNL